MFEWIQTVFNAIQSNPIVAGLFGTTVLSGIAVYLRNVPIIIYNWIKRYSITTLYVYSNEEQYLYTCINEYLKQQRIITFGNIYELSKKRTSTDLNRLSVGTYVVGRSIDREQMSYIQLSLQTNTTYLVKLFGYNALITKYTDDASKQYKNLFYKIDMFVKDKHKILYMFNEMVRIQECLQVDTYDIFYYTGRGWNNIKRTKLDSSLIFNKTEDIIISKIAKFLNSKENYQRHQKIYKEGFIFYGIPGCGKSYLCQKLASLFDMNLYYVNLNAFSTDEHMLEALGEIGPNSIILIEDIDSFKVSNTRSVVFNNKEKANKKDNSNSLIDTIGITLSGLLNILDGPLSKDEQLVVITTNHLEKLDPALIRAGRFNTKIEFTYMESKEICSYITTYYDNDKQEKYDHRIFDNVKNITISELVNICKDYEEDMNGCVSRILEYSKEKSSDAQKQNTEIS